MAVCDNCHKAADRLFDTKTKQGPWAYLCGKCAPKVGHPAYLDTKYTTTLVYHLHGHVDQILKGYHPA